MENEKALNQMAQGFNFIGLEILSIYLTMNFLVVPLA